MPDDDLMKGVNVTQLPFCTRQSRCWNVTVFLLELREITRSTGRFIWPWFTEQMFWVWPSDLVQELAPLHFAQLHTCKSRQRHHRSRASLPIKLWWTDADLSYMSFIKQCFHTIFWTWSSLESDALHTQTFECLKQQWGPLVIGQFLTTQEVILGYCSGLRSCDAQTRGSPGVPACRLEGKKSCRRSISVTEHMRPSWQKLLDTHWRRCAGCLLRRWVTPNRPQLLSVEENCRHVDEINAKYRDELWNAVFSASVESRALIKIQKQASRCFEILNLTSYINCDVQAAHLKSELKCELERHHESKRNEARSQNSKLELN